MQGTHETLRKFGHRSLSSRGCYVHDIAGGTAPHLTPIQSGKQHNDPPQALDLGSGSAADLPGMPLSVVELVELVGQAGQVVGVQVEPVRGSGWVTDGAGDVGGAQAEACAPRRSQAWEATISSRSGGHPETVTANW